MSQIKVFTVVSDNVVRVKTADGTGGQGSGANSRLYVGDAGTYRYRSLAKVTPNWSGVGRIVRATLVVYTDDGLGGKMPLPSATDTPKVLARRLTSAFATGNNADEDFDATDYTNPTATSAGQSLTSMAKAADAVTRINVTGIFNAIAPKTVQQSNGAAGLGLTNYGIVLMFGKAGSASQWAGWSQHHSDPSLRPTIELEYEYGLTTPDVPTALVPSGAVDSLVDFEGDFVDVRTQDLLAAAEVQVYQDDRSGTAAITDVVTSAAHGLANGESVYFTSLTGGTGLSAFTRYYVRDKTTNTFKVAAAVGGAAVDITVAYTALKWSRLIWSQKQNASNAEVVAERFSLIPSGLVISARTTYKWRARVYDNQAQVSGWSALTSFSVSNTAPNPPTLTPLAATYASLNGVLFRGGEFSDADAGDTLGAYQIQLADLPVDDPLWEDADRRKWDTGKVLTVADATNWERAYGGQSLDAGTYRWRARNFDNRGAASAWAYTTITLTADFVVDPGTEDTVQVDPRAPWRIVIKDMKQADGVTPTAGRGPGRTVAILENAKSTGASKMYNSPGELHFTLPVDHPQLSVIEPKQTHYSVQFYSGDGWREKYAGLIDDFDATETGVIIYGIDYLALFGRVWDERFDPANPDLPAADGGSKYVDKTVSHIVTDQLTRAVGLTNSEVGFISIGSIDAMSEHVTIWSTMQNTLQFCAALIDSHRQGTGKNTRMQVVRTTLGGYEIRVDDDPGSAKDALRMKYGELVQGYRVIAFGKNWASRTHTIGRTREGIKVMYKTEVAPGIDESVWGRIAVPQLMDDVSDENDLIRRTKQAAIQASKLGKQLGIGIRSGVIQPLDGYDICDSIPVAIQHGAVDTTRFGSGYWTIYGVTWEAADNGNTSTTLTLLPRNDTTPPDTDLLVAAAISPQAEWQIGWTAPDPLTATSSYWLDQTTGKVYFRESDGSYTLVSSGAMTPPTPPSTPTGLSLGSAAVLQPDGTVAVRLTIALDAAADARTRSTTVSVTTGGDPMLVVFQPDQTTATIENVLGGVLHTASAVAYDVFGNPSASLGGVTHTTTTDTTAPAQVTGLAAFGAILGLIATWNASAATDLAHYEVQVDDSNTFPSPDTFKIKSTVLALQQIAAGTWYFRVRAVDLSGNAGAYSTTVSATSRTVQTGDLADALITTAKLVAGAVTDVELAAAAVTAAKIAVDAVTASAIATGAVGSSEIAALAVTTAKLAAGAVTTTELGASAVTTAKIAADAVTAGEIAAGAVGSSELAAGAVIAGKITAGTIVAADIAAGTITGAKIAAGTIAASNIVADTITANEIAAGAVSTSELDALAVTTAKLAAGAVTAAKITAGTITATEIAALTIVAANIAAGTITAAKIAAGTITATEIAALTIVAANIAAGTITGAKIAAGTITATNIAADTITANEIAAGAITSTELAAGAVTAGKITAGTIATADLNAACSIQLVSNAGATVVINAAGITITNGSLTIQDEFGATALGATGFAGSWSDFIALNLYNAAFRAGVVGAIALGRTVALPFWTVANEAGLGVATFLGPGVKFTFAATGNIKKLSSDLVPIQPGDKFHVRINFDVTRVAGTLDLTFEVVFWDATQVFSASGGEQSVTGGGTAVSMARSTYETSVADTGNNSYAQVIIRAKETVAHNAGNLIDLYGVGLRFHGEQFSNVGSTTVNTTDASVLGLAALHNSTQDGYRPGMTALLFAALTTVTGTGDTVLRPTGSGPLGGTRDRYFMPWAGRIVGIALQDGSSRTAGTLTGIPLISGASPASPRAVIDGTNVASKATTATYAAGPTFAAGDTIGMIATGAGFTPTANNLLGTIYVIFDAVGA